LPTDFLNGDPHYSPFGGLMGSLPQPGGGWVDSHLARVSGSIMSHKRDSDSSPGALSARELAVLEYFAEGLSDLEIAVRNHVTLRHISAIRRRAAAKLATRIGSARPFQICEVVVSRSLDSAAL
jgi:DNA-binding CsgD family transcriptional regulator